MCVGFQANEFLVDVCYIAESRLETARTEDLVAVQVPVVRKQRDLTRTR